MFVSIDHVRQPENPDSRIWRYMDLTKFLSILETSSLFFSNLERLEDPFEGTWPAKHASSLITPHHLKGDELIRFREEVASVRKKLRGHYAVSCWHMSEYESAAMWSLFTKGDESIAVQTRYERLKTSLKPNEPFGMGLVEYIDYNAYEFSSHDSTHTVMHKRQSFEFEKEVRAFIFRSPNPNPTLPNAPHQMVGPGIAVPIDVHGLIENVYVSPKSQHWFTSLVGALLVRYGFSLKPVQSSLADSALY